jgi:hypothetical protein
MHAVWLKNRMSTKALNGKMPYEALYKTAPDLSDLLEWGCNVWIHDHSTGKIGTCAKPAYWVGYDQNSNGHRIFWPKKRNIMVERSIRFSTTGLPVIIVDSVELEGEGGPPKVDATVEGTDEPDENEDNSAPPQFKTAVLNLPPARPCPPPAEPMIRTPHVRRVTQYIRDIQADRGWADNRPAQPNVPVGMRISAPSPQEESDDGTTEGTEPELIEEIGAMAMTVEMANALGLEPCTFAEVKRRPAWPQWKDAMEEEHNALEVHKTWGLKKPPLGFKVIGNQWVYHVKRDAAGAINHYRARLVILGNHQCPRIDCFDTYAPVAKITSI